MKANDAIWLIDDDRIDIMTVRRAFQKLNVSNPLDVFTMATDALKSLEEKKVKPSIILLDLNMPRMNGIEFLRIVKSNPEWRRIPVIVVTTSRNITDKIQCYDLQVAGYFVKPVDFFKMAEAMYNYWSSSETI